MEIRDMTAQVSISGAFQHHVFMTRSRATGQHLRRVRNRTDHPAHLGGVRAPRS